MLGNRSNSSITSEMSGGDPSRQKGEGNAQNKLDFFEFKRVLIALAMQIFRREEEESYLCLLQTLLGSPTFAQKDELEGNLLSLKDSLKSDPAIRHAGVLVRRQLSDVFKRYCRHRRVLMDFKHFVLFCRDHDVFPEIASKALLMKVFGMYCGSIAQPKWSARGSPSQSPGKLTLEESTGRLSQQFETLQYVDEEAFTECLMLVALAAAEDEANANIEDEDEQDTDKET